MTPDQTPAARRPTRKPKLRLESLEDRRNPATSLHTLLPDVGPQTDAKFGTAAATDGFYHVVGAPFSDAGGVADVGQAFVYDSAGALVATLKAPTPAASDQFGSAVAVSDGKVVVGAFQDDAGTANAGQAYVFDTAGRRVATLKQPHPGDQRRPRAVGGGGGGVGGRRGERRQSVRDHRRGGVCVRRRHRRPRRHAEQSRPGGL